MLCSGTTPSDLQGGSEPEIRCEPDLDAESRRLFEQAGFPTAVMPPADIGCAKWVMREEQGQLIAACDTGRDGACVLGIVRESDRPAGSYVCCHRQRK
jgi:hypothetical protein